MWLNATVFTLYLNEHCQRGWTRLWAVCDPSSAHYKVFDIRLGEHRLLEPLKDLCLSDHEHVHLNRGSLLDPTLLSSCTAGMELG